MAPSRPKKTQSKKKSVLNNRSVKSKSTIKKPTVKRLVSSTEFAKIMGVQPRAVQSAASAGRITAIRDGRNLRIDPITAKKQWLENTHGKSKVVKAEKTTKGMTLADAEKKEKIFKAKLAELKYLEASKQLVSVDRVKRQAFEMGRKIRDAILNVPQRVSAEVMTAKKQFDIEEILNREIIEVLKLLSDGK